MPAPREMTETKYVAVGDADVAYRVMGDGPFDLLYFYGLGSHVDMHSDDQLLDGQFLDELASFSRLIFFDRRGTGASGGLSRNAMPAWEEWADDVRAVLDGAGSERTVIFAAHDAGPIAMMFAALQPERVSALILANTSPRYLEADDYPIGMSQAWVDAVVETMASLWGTEELAAIINPPRARRPGVCPFGGTETTGFRYATRRGCAVPLHPRECRRSFGVCLSSRLRRWCSTRVRTRCSPSTMVDTSPITSQRRSSLRCPGTGSRWMLPNLARCSRRSRSS